MFPETFPTLSPVAKNGPTNIIKDPINAINTPILSFFEILSWSNIYPAKIVRSGEIIVSKLRLRRVVFAAPKNKNPNATVAFKKQYSKNRSNTDGFLGICNFANGNKNITNKVEIKNL